MAVSDIVGDLTKGYLYTHLAKDGARLWKRWSRELDFDLDTDGLLHKVGMARYSPGKQAMGGMGFLLLGAAVGAVVALALAPKSGAELRADVKEKARDLFDQARNGIEDEVAVERRTHA